MPNRSAKQSGTLTNINPTLQVVSGSLPKECGAEFYVRYFWANDKRFQSTERPNATFAFDVVGGGSFGVITPVMRMEDLKLPVEYISEDSEGRKRRQTGMQAIKVPV